MSQVKKSRKSVLQPTRATGVFITSKDEVPEWTLREKLGLLSAINQFGDEDWPAVVKALKSLVEDRPPGWFSAKNCSLQFLKMIEAAEYRRKYGSDKAKIVKGMTIELQEQYKHFLKANLPNGKNTYGGLKERVEGIMNNAISDDEVNAIYEEYLAEKDGFVFSESDEYTDVDEDEDEDDSNMIPKVVAEESVPVLVPVPTSSLSPSSYAHATSVLPQSPPMELIALHSGSSTPSFASPNAPGTPKCSDGLQNLLQSAISGVSESPKARAAQPAPSPTLSMLLEQPPRSHGQPLPPIPRTPPTMFTETARPPLAESPLAFSGSDRRAGYASSISSETSLGSMCSAERRAEEEIKMEEDITASESEDDGQKAVDVELIDLGNSAEEDNDTTPEPTTPILANNTFAPTAQVSSAEREPQILEEQEQMVYRIYQANENIEASLNVFIMETGAPPVVSNEGESLPVLDNDDEVAEELSAAESAVHFRAPVLNLPEQEMQATNLEINVGDEGEFQSVEEKKDEDVKEVEVKRSEPVDPTLDEASDTESEALTEPVESIPPIPEEAVSTEEDSTHGEPEEEKIAEMRDKITPIDVEEPVSTKSEFLLLAPEDVTSKEAEGNTNMDSEIRQIEVLGAGGTDNKLNEEEKIPLTHDAIPVKQNENNAVGLEEIIPSPQCDVSAEEKEEIPVESLKTTTKPEPEDLEAVEFDLDDSKTTSANTEIVEVGVGGEDLSVVEAPMDVDEEMSVPPTPDEEPAIEEAPEVEHHIPKIKVAGRRNTRKRTRESDSIDDDGEDGKDKTPSSHPAKKKLRASRLQALYKEANTFFPTEKFATDESETPEAKRVTRARNKGAPSPSPVPVKRVTETKPKTPEVLPAYETAPQPLPAEIDTFTKSLGFAGIDVEALKSAITNLNNDPLSIAVEKNDKVFTGQDRKLDGEAQEMPPKKLTVRGKRQKPKLLKMLSSLMAQPNAGAMMVDKIANFVGDKRAEIVQDDVNLTLLKKLVETNQISTVDDLKMHLYIMVNNYRVAAGTGKRKAQISLAAEEINELFKPKRPKLS